MNPVTRHLLPIHPHPETTATLNHSLLTSILLADENNRG